MQKVRTKDLEGSSLEWAVADALRVGPKLDPINGQVIFRHDAGPWCRANFLDWSEAGPIIQREAIAIEPIFKTKSPGNLADLDRWYAKHPKNHGGLLRSNGSGPTPIVAAMRCFVSATLGDEVSVPKELKINPEPRAGDIHIEAPRELDPPPGMRLRKSRP